MDSLYRELLTTATLAAEKAAAIIREENEQPRQFWMKGYGDFLTKTDLAAQEAILDVISTRHPDHNILAEEEKKGQHRRPDGTWIIPDGITWHIDPLDGTTNYTFGLPLSCTSVGVTIDGVPSAGVIIDPFRNDVFAGAIGQGASLNGDTLPSIQPPESLEYSLMQIGWVHSTTDREVISHIFDRVVLEVMSVRSLGTAAIMLANVAASRSHLFLSLGLSPWDTCAGAAMIHEVGGVFKSPWGDDWKVGDLAFVTGHPALVDEVIERINAT